MNGSTPTTPRRHRIHRAPVITAMVVALAMAGVATATAATPQVVARAGIATRATGAHVHGAIRTITGTLTVPAGTTMTLAPGSHLRFTSGARLVVQGTLRAAGTVTLDGSDWNGVVVAQRGGLDVANGTISGATNAITVQAGAQATLDHVRITGESSPFVVLPTGRLTLRHVTVARAQTQSTIDGTLHATALDYNKGASEGITALQGTARITIVNSRLHGDGPNTGDMLSMRKGDALTVSNTEVTGAHCAFHIVGLRSLALDHVNIHGNSYGFMMYETSKTGTKTIVNSNIVDNRDFGIDEGSRFNSNGPITIRNTYIAHNGHDLALYTHAITVVQPAAHAIAIP